MDDRRDGGWNRDGKGSETGIDLVFHDVNENARLDRGEPRLGGYRVFLDKNNNGRYDSREPATRSDSTGNYEFDGVPVGTWSVRQTPVVGWGFTTPQAYRVRVDGVTDVRKHFGNVPRASILGTVFRDNNVNRVRDAGETGLSGWQVFLDADLDGLLDADEKSVLTDLTGNGRFDDLPANTYTIRLVQPSGWRLTTPALGSFTLTALTGSTIERPYLFGQKRIA